MLRQELYLAVLPLIHFPGSSRIAQAGVRAEQILTLFPDRRFATEFFPDEVEDYMENFRSAATMYLTGGHVRSYQLQTESTQTGRLIVKVTQYVE